MPSLGLISNGRARSVAGAWPAPFAFRAALAALSRRPGPPLSGVFRQDIYAQALRAACFPARFMPIVSGTHCTYGRLHARTAASPRTRTHARTHCGADAFHQHPTHWSPHCTTPSHSTEMVSSRSLRALCCLLALECLLAVREKLAEAGIRARVAARRGSRRGVVRFAYARGQSPGSLPASASQASTTASTPTATLALA